MVIFNQILHQSIHIYIHINNIKIQQNKTTKLAPIKPIHIQ